MELPGLLLGTLFQHQVLIRMEKGLRGAGPCGWLLVLVEHQGQIFNGVLTEKAGPSLLLEVLAQLVMEMELRGTDPSG